MASNFSVRHLSQTNKWNKTHGKFHCTKNKHFIETNCTQLTITTFCYHFNYAIASTPNNVFDLLWRGKVASYCTPINIPKEYRAWNHNMMTPVNWFQACHCPSSNTHLAYSKYVIILWFRISSLFKIHSKADLVKMFTI